MSERQPPPRVGRSIGAVLAGMAMPCAWAGGKLRQMQLQERAIA